MTIRLRAQIDKNNLTTPAPVKVMGFAKRLNPSSAVGWVERKAKPTVRWIANDGT